MLSTTNNKSLLTSFMGSSPYSSAGQRRRNVKLITHWRARYPCVRHHGDVLGLAYVPQTALPDFTFVLIFISLLPSWLSVCAVPSLGLGTPASVAGLYVRFNLHCLLSLAGLSWNAFP